MSFDGAKVRKFSVYHNFFVVFLLQMDVAMASFCDKCLHKLTIFAAEKMTIKLF